VVHAPEREGDTRYVLYFDDDRDYGLVYCDARSAHARYNEAKKMEASGWSLADFVEEWF
jgi:hypothetical protein